MALPELQRALSRHIQSQGDEIVAAVVSDAILDAPSRLAVYRDGYAIRLTEALDAHFPMLHKLLGDEEFSRLARCYLEQHPSRHRSIRWFGTELPSCLAAEARYAKQPALTELARWEWAMTLAFDALDAQPIGREALGRFEPEEFARLRFRFHPSLQRLRLAWNAPAVWQALSQDLEPPAPVQLDTPVHWIIWRQQLTSYYRSLSPGESDALELARARGAFGDLCEHLAASEEPNPALRAATLLNTWLGGGLIVDMGLG